MPKAYSIVWNEDRSEGVIFDSQEDATAIANGVDALSALDSAEARAITRAA